MDLTTLIAKPNITKNGEEIIDISEPVYGRSKNGIKIIDMFYVADMEMRPDLLSHVAYSNDNFLDFILKFNGISNPYSLDKDWLVYIPEISDFSTKLQTVVKPVSTQSNKNAFKDQYVEKPTNVDPRRKAFHKMIDDLKKKGYNTPKDLRPPTIQEDGLNEATVTSDGNVIL